MKENKTNEGVIWKINTIITIMADVHTHISMNVEQSESGVNWYWNYILSII